MKCRGQLKNEFEWGRMEGEGREASRVDDQLQKLFSSDGRKLLH